MLPSLRFDDFAAAQAGSADADVLGGGSHLSVNGAQVDIPAALADVVGVADGVTQNCGPLPADIAYSCHNSRILPG